VEYTPDASCLGCRVPFVRAIALVINSTIGSGIFGLPAEVTRLVGRASPISMVTSGLVTAAIAACLAEVASQFSEPGGAYLYVRTAFGRFAGMQAGWFSLLAPCAGGAANASLFILYLAAFFPLVGHGIDRVLLLIVLIGIPTFANYVGVRSGARLTNVLTVAKPTPLAVLILLGVARFGRDFELIHVNEVTRPGLGAWLSAFLLLTFAYGGFEHPLIPTGEVKDIRRTIPFALGIAGECNHLHACAVRYRCYHRSDLNKPTAGRRRICPAR
jgi:basic amino acid/polyamine antiporter, APA family